MFDSNKVLAVMREGTGFVCAHCNNFWWSVDRGYQGGCKALRDGMDCSGPIRGMAFPYYQGPLEGNLHNYCFVCGAKPSANAIAKTQPGSPRCGVCQDHLKLLETHSAPGERPPFLTHTYVPVIL